MIVKLKAEIDLKRFQQAAVLMDVDIPDEETLKKWCESEMEMPKEIMTDDKMREMRLFFAMVVIYSNLEDED